MHAIHVGSALHNSKLPKFYADNKKLRTEAELKQQSPPQQSQSGGVGGVGASEEQQQQLDEGLLPSPYRPRRQYPVHEDAFATLMQWLHWRMEVEGGRPS